MASAKWARRRNKQKEEPGEDLVEDPPPMPDPWVKRRRTDIKKQRAERARRNAGTASTNRRDGHKKKAAPSPSIRGQSGSNRKGRPKRPQASSSRS